MFALLPIRELSPKHFAEHPVWADYEEPGNIDQIVGWGVPRADVVRELERVSYSDAFMFPVLRTRPLPSFRFLYLSAALTAADGTQFSGYVLGAHPYCVAVFHGDESFMFNLNLPDMAENQLSRLRHLSGLRLAPFFPLHYSTQFHRGDGEPVVGVFDYNRNA
jgi:hypothetical protein